MVERRLGPSCSSDFFQMILPHAELFFFSSSSVHLKGAARRQYIKIEGNVSKQDCFQQENEFIKISMFHEEEKKQWNSQQQI